MCKCKQIYPEWNVKTSLVMNHFKIQTQDFSDEQNILYFNKQIILK
jgi:hypothetical protein